MFALPKLLTWCCVLSFISSACTIEPTTGQFSMEIVGLSKNKPAAYELREVGVNKSPELLAQENQEFIFLSKIKIAQKQLAHAALVSSSFDHMRYLLQKNITGHPIIPIYSNTNQVFRANTFESLLAMSAFYHFDQIRKFADKLKLLEDPHDQLALRVGIYGEIFMSSFDILPVVSNDNAVYIGSADVIALLPVGSSQGLPMSMNEGILAHEYHHRLFFNQVWVNNSNNQRWKRYQARYNKSKQLSVTRTHILLAATDEALADLFAIAFTGVVDFMTVSLTTPKGNLINKQRDLRGNFANLVTYDDLANEKLRPEFRLYCPAKSKNFTNSKFNIYCLATIIAKVFFEASEQEIYKLANIAIPLAHKALPLIGKVLEKNKSYDLELFFDAVARESKKLDPIFHRKFCAELAKRFRSLYLSGLSSCD